MSLVLVTALYLAHLNPVTNAHVEIVGDLLKRSSRVKVMPVVFYNGTRELNSKSFPFTFSQREEMMRAVFGDRVDVTHDYAFYAPFRRYLPPLLAPKSWALRRQILSGVEGDYFTYTGDRAEGYMLRLYRLRPQVGRRRPLSATSVKEKMYRAAAAGPESGWENDVPPAVIPVIQRHWDAVEKFVDAPDRTVRILGMKFPKEGY